MKRAMILLGAYTISQPLFAEQKETIILYQVGQNGSYCVSITPDSSGCVSGTDENGNRYNTLDITQGKEVIFRNVSDAPHDMVITGANKSNIPAQAPNGNDAVKKMDVEDQNKEKITCSFHGDMLAVGYRVPKRVSGEDSGEGHKENPDAPRNEGASDFRSSELNSTENANKKIVRTGLADVSNEVLKKGSPEVVERLLASRPELKEKLQEIRPLLAKELASPSLTKPTSALGNFPGGDANAADKTALAAARLKSADGRAMTAPGAGGLSGVDSALQTRELDSEGEESFFVDGSEDGEHARLSTEPSANLKQQRGKVAGLGQERSPRTQMMGTRELASLSPSRRGRAANSEFSWLWVGLAAALAIGAQLVIRGTRRRQKQNIKS